MKRKYIICVLTAMLLFGGCGQQPGQASPDGISQTAQPLDTQPTANPLDTQNEQPPAGSMDTQNTQPSAGTQNSQPSADMTGAQNTQSQAGTVGAQDSQPSAGMAGAQNTQPQAGTVGAQDSQPSAGMAGAQNTQPQAGTMGAQDFQPSAGMAGTQNTQPPANPLSTPETQFSAGHGHSQPHTGMGSNSSNNTAAETELITIDTAKNNALAHAGLTSDQVTFLESKLDYEDGRQVYEIEFYTADYKEYDYELDAYTGEIISYDYDAEHYISSANNATAGSAITAEQAKELALAKVPGASAGDIREFETDYDDGRTEYEGKIIYGGMEYEFEIDASSGAFLSWEAEPVGH